MLILTRRTGESLRVGDDITIAVLGVQGSQVRIGIDAPKHIEVHREEIYRRILRERRSEGYSIPQQDSQTQATKTIDYPETASTEEARLTHYSSEGMGKTKNKTPEIKVKKRFLFNKP